MSILKKFFSNIRNLLNKDFISHSRNNFITGLIVILPSIVTIWVVIFIFKLFGSPIGIILNKLFLGGNLSDEVETFLGFFLAITIISFMGYITKMAITRPVFHFIERYINSIPLINTIYSTIKKIINTLMKDKSSFKYVGLIEYPRKGVYTVCFVTKSQFTELTVKGDPTKHQFTSVFVPTTPNPTSGFFLLVPKDEVRVLDISVEQGIKLIVSAGVLDIN